MSDSSRRRALRFAKFALVGWTPVFLLIGFLITRSGMLHWDSLSHLQQSQWLIGSYLGRDLSEFKETVTHIRWYGPLWELFLGVFTEVVFKFLNDPTWVRESVNFALYPLTLYVVFIFLIENGVKFATAGLALALIFSNIRLAGHSVFEYNGFSIRLWLFTFHPLPLEAGSGFAAWDKHAEMDRWRDADFSGSLPPANAVSGSFCDLGSVCLVLFIFFGTTERPSLEKAQSSYFTFPLRSFDAPLSLAVALGWMAGMAGMVGQLCLDVPVSLEGESESFRN